ncbi:MAG: S8 family serine peptidase [Desulfobulbaceae bacterium]|nr:S8 family serine peptidase [Desulfobulbaceae bacterium]HIJ79931.1 S8 family serine peptidase [Deltaproteobacteria bacterium]
MRKIRIMATLLMALMLIAGPGGNPVLAQPQFEVKEFSAHPATGHAPGEIIVQFRPGLNANIMARINRAHGASVLATSRFSGAKRLKIAAGKTVAEMVAIYRRNPNVLYAEPNFLAHTFEVPNDQLYSYQWHLDNVEYGGIGMEEAWAIEPGGDPGVIVAVIDTGVAYEDYAEYLPIGPKGRKVLVEYAHAPDLTETAFVPGYDFINNDDHPNDDYGHGTHVTGTIAQSTNNDIGVAGIAYNTSIMPVKVLDQNGSGTYFDVADGIYFAAEQGAKVINLSLGGPSPAETLELALAAAHNSGVTIVCSSGNDGLTAVSYPAAYDDYCIAVGATRYDEEVAPYSNRGAALDLTAPGGDTTVDQNGDGYVDGVLQQTHNGSDYTSFSYYFYQGTSMAAPHVTGVAALLISNGIADDPASVREVLQATAEDHGVVGWDPDYGWGIVDAAAALAYASGGNTPPVAVAGGPYTGTENESVTFDGHLSSDADGDTLTYAWDFGDETSGSGVAPEHTYTRGGLYNVTLTVSDGKIASEPVTTTADIAETNDPPVAEAGLDQTAQVDEVLFFDGNGSSDEEGDALTYTWDFGDGSPTDNSGALVSHAYSAAGTYTVTLIVDDGELSHKDTATVRVTDASVQMMHVAAIDMALRMVGVNTSAQAIITIVDSNNAPVAGVSVSGQWSGATSDLDTGTTDLNGQVLLLSNNVKRAKSGTSFTFTVTGVELADWTYDAELNVVNSNSITVP